uniref:BPI2 domain-containing protein n=1 Tax=Thelazia callipaeda TaxID=103827 RepID=A0A0N5D3V5_THECL
LHFQKLVRKGSAVQGELSQVETLTDSSTRFFDKSDFKSTNNLNKNVGMLVRITPRMINYWAKELRLMFQEELQNVPLPEFSRILMKLNVSILAPKIQDAKFPRFSYKVHANNTVETVLRGGSAQLLSSYRAVYRTVREGHLVANISEFIINIKFKIGTTFAGKLVLENIVCGAEVRSINVKLTPKLHQLVDEGLRIELNEALSVVICDSLETFTNKFEERLNKLIRSPILNIRINDTTVHFLIDSTISNDISISEDHFDFPVLGTPMVYNMESEIHSLTILPSDKLKMVYLYVSEVMMNTFLRQIDIFTDKVLYLHSDPAFRKMLDLKCSDNEKCIGDLLQDTELYAPDSGKMVIKMHSPLVASIKNGYMLINLYLSTYITYKQDELDVKVMEFELLGTVRIDDYYVNEQLTEKHESVRNRNSMLQLSELSIRNVTPYVEMISNYDGHLLQIISLRKELLQKLLLEQCSMIKSTTSDLYQTVNCTVTFRNKTLVIATDLEWNPEVFHYFNFSF